MDHQLDIKAELTPAQQRMVWQLLQATSREPGSPYAIEDEYPIVLGDRMHSASYCLARGSLATKDDIVCHSSYWPRQLLSHQGATTGIAVGLIGNVATHPEWRKRGMMTKLLTQISELATAAGVSALILWSDLTGLYDKLGFVPTSKEVRYVFHQDQLLELLSADQLDEGRQLKPVSTDELTDADLARCLALRPKVPFTLARSLAEFRLLLSIPNLFVFVRRGADAAISSFYLVEKGADMPQVIHEWGTASAELMPAEITTICQALGYQQVLLLAPATLPKPIQALCRHYALAEDTHPMALVKMLSADPARRKALQSAFVWGLDGI